MGQWKLVLSPQECPRWLGHSLVDMQLINRLPRRLLHTTYDRGPLSAGLSCSVMPLISSQTMIGSKTDSSR
jgi:hypothetical protein